MVFIIFLYYLLILTAFFYFFHKEKITPVVIFIVSQGMFFSGLISFFDFNSTKDKTIVWIYFLGILFFCVGAGLGNYIHPINKTKVVFSEDKLSKRQECIMIYLIIFSVFLFCFFCYKTRFSTIKIMLANIIGNQFLDITDARLASYSVPGMGIIYAFRITLLPAIAVSFSKYKKYSKLNIILLCSFMIFFTLITGQRGGFVFVMFMWLLSYSIPLFYRKKDKVNKKIKKYIAFIIILLFGMFFFLSIINGRVHGSLFGAVIKRFFYANQESAYYAFYYIFNVGTCWGQNYYEEIVNLLVSGDKYLPLSRVINNIMYGTTRGTAPPCLWGSVFYNFSWLGVIIFGLLYGLFAQYIGHRLYSRKINPIRGVIYSYMFIDIGMLVAGGPLQLFNNGFVPLVVLAYILHIDKWCKKENIQFQRKNLLEEIHE